MDRGAWQATVHGVAKSRTRLKGLNTHTGREDFSSTADHDAEGCLESKSPAEVLQVGIRCVPEGGRVFRKIVMMF